MRFFFFFSGILIWLISDLNQETMKLSCPKVYEKYYPAFARKPFQTTGIPPCWNERKSIAGSSKRNNNSWRHDESYENLLNRSDDISIHQKHLRYLAIEVYKSLAKLNPGFMWNFFERNHTPYNLRRGDLLLLSPAKSIRCGVNSLAFQRSLLWKNLLPQVKESQTLQEFKNRIKNLRSIHCACTVCRWSIMPFYFNL